MKTSIKRILSMLALLLASLAVAACGGEEETGGGGSGGDSGGEKKASQLIEPIAGAEGKKISFGSKNFPEQYILGQIYAQTLAAAGFDVAERVDDLGAEQVAYKSLKAGEVDAYPEYTGTALTSFFDYKVTDDRLKDSAQSYALAKEEYAKEDITALPPSKFDNTYALISSVEQQKKYGAKTMTELAPAAKGDKLAGFPECRQRADCLLGLQDTYDFDVEYVSTQGQFEPIDKNQSELALVFATDGKLSLTDKYATYEDDKKLFPVYNITLTMRNEAAKLIGQEGQDLIKRVQDGLTPEAMRELNSRVQIDKQEPKAVATAYLTESGFIE